MARKLRIAWSVICWGSCLLLIALWVRSYYWHDYVNRVGSNAHVRITSGGGKVVLKVNPLDPAVLYGSYPSYGSEKQTASRDMYTTAFAGQFGHNRIISDVGTHHSYWAPIWFFILLSTALAVLPWFPWSHRFSLRTLLIAATVVAVLLGVIIYTVK